MGDAAPPPEPVDARFESFLDAAADASLPEDIRAQIRAGLTRQHANPPVRPTEAILRSRLTPTRVRELAYYPDDDDAELYALLIRSPPDGAPSDHPAARCQVTYLMTLYLSHSKRWAFAKRFVLAGGLVTLVNLLDHDDPQAARASDGDVRRADARGAVPVARPPGAIEHVGRRGASTDARAGGVAVDFAPVRKFQSRRDVPGRRSDGAADVRVLRVVAAAATLPAQRPTAIAGPPRAAPRVGERGRRGRGREGAGEGVGGRLRRRRRTIRTTRGETR